MNLSVSAKRKWSPLLVAFFVFALVFSGISVPQTASAATQATYYVSPTGSDSNNGTSTATPFQTIGKAQSVVRTISANMTGDIIVYLRGGTYTAGNTISFGSADSGTNGYNVKYLAYPGEKPIISGGQALSGTWTLSDSSKNIYALTGVTSDFRQLYVNGQKAIRSRTPNTGSYNRMISADRTNYTVTINSSEISNWNNFSQVEMHAMLAWSEAILRLSSYMVSGTQAIIKFQTPESNIVFPRPYPSIGNLGRADHIYYFENAYEFIDTEGEWYLNKSTQTLYYKPRAGENMANAQVVAPKLETIVSVQGTLDNPVHHIWFSGITFQHSTFMRPSQYGFVDAQAFQYNISATTDNKQYIARPPAGVYVAAANNLRFERNTFTQMGATALDFHYGTHDDMIIGNVVSDISGTGISIGKFTQDENTEYHVPYNPTDVREISTNDTIQNNYIHDIATDYQGAVGIGAGYPKGITISHNEIFNTPYSGISVGYGWTYQDNAMSGNKIDYNDIHHVAQLMADGGAIYTLSKQPNSSVGYNYIHDFSWVPTSDYSNFGMYFDEGTSGYTIHDNVFVNVQGMELIHYNGTSSSNTASNNDSQDATFIATTKSNAGIEAAYKDIKQPNLITNPGFETDGATQSPTGWSTWSGANTYAADYTESYGGANSGTYHLTHYNGQTGSWNVYTNQTFTGLANGTYTLSAWVRKSGNGFTYSYMEAKNFGGTTVAANIPDSSTYQQITVSNINVTNGQCSIGFWTQVDNGSNNPFVYIDDVSFTKN